MRLISITALAAVLMGASWQASAQSIDDCEHSGDSHGVGVQSGTLKAQCFSKLLASAPAASARRSDDQKLLAFGHRNLLFIQSIIGGKTYRNVVSGKESQLHDVGAVALDPKNGEILAIERSSRRILVFRSDAEGNVCPIRKLSTPAIPNPAAVAVDADHDELIVADGDTNSLQIFLRMADVDGRRPPNQTSVIRSIAGGATQLSSPIDVAVDPKHGEIFVLNAGSSEILVFDRASSGNAAPVRVIQGPSTGLQNPGAVYYSASSDRIVVFNGNGELLQFARSSSGDAAPAGSN